MLAAMLADGSFRVLLDAPPQGPALPHELLEGARQAQVRLPSAGSIPPGASPAPRAAGGRPTTPGTHQPRLLLINDLIAGTILPLIPWLFAPSHGPPQADAERRLKAQGADSELPELLGEITAAGALPRTESRLGR